VLDQYLCKKAKDKLEPNAFISYAIGRLQDSPAVWTIEKLSQKVGYTQKHLISLFKKHAGLSPKVLSRILKFQYVIGQIERQESLDWTDIAYGCGYYDQAHFIKEFRAFSGINPSSYLTQRGDYLNYIPVRG
jgi:AraC-like DNA-binding protein